MHGLDIASPLLKLFLALVLFSSSHCEEDDAIERDSDYHEMIEPSEDHLTVGQLHKLHAKFDANGDGKASLQEVMDHASAVGKAMALQHVAAFLPELDTSKDGTVSLEEHMNDIFNQAENGNEEALNDLAARKDMETTKFHAADANGDGQLDKDELTALFHPELNDGVMSIAVKESMRQKDTNEDSLLTRNEFFGATRESDVSKEERADFKKLDVNGDGSVDLQELRVWESGKFHIEAAMKQILEAADKDNDLHVTADELAGAIEAITSLDAHHHLSEWALHHEL